MARVLVADDDRVIRATMSYLLDTKGHEVVEADSRREEFARIASDIFDPLILETIKQVSQHDAALPILVVSGMTFRSGPRSTEAPDFLADFLVVATKLGAVRSLRKPFRASALLTAVEDCLNIPVVEEDVQPDDWQGSLESSA